jgi:hypothetical protein
MDPLRSGRVAHRPPSSPSDLGGAGLRKPKMAVEYSIGYTSGGAEGVCVFGAWVGCDEDSCKQEMERVLVGRWRHGSEDMDMQAHRVILNRLQWRTPGRRFVSGSAPGNTGLSDVIIAVCKKVGATCLFEKTKYLCHVRAENCFLPYLTQYLEYHVSFYIFGIPEMSPRCL